jgi:GT2 family glycosyltransferase
MQNSVTASIVIYKNNQAILRKAIECFLESTTNSKLYLIDNSPNRVFPPYYENERIEYIFNNKNLGFGAGHNVALKTVIAQNESKYHLVLNPDVYFTKEVVTKMLAYMDGNLEVGLAMPKVLYPDGRLQPACKLLPTPVTLFSRRFLGFIPGWINRVNELYEMHFSGYDKIMDVPFLSGCFMFLRVDALRKVGLFDEQIFLYTEDTDLTRRIHQYYRTIYYPNVSIFHHHEKASYKNTITMLHHIRSAITYFNKWGWFTDFERDAINQQILLKLTR